MLDASDEIKTGTKTLWRKRSVKYQNKSIFNDEFFKAGKYDFYQLVPDGDLFSYDEMAIKLKMTRNNHSFIKYVNSSSTLIHQVR